MNVFIERFAKIPGYGTFGRAHAGGLMLGYTVEQPWQNNRPFESCIPDGDYELRRRKSPTYGSLFVAVNHELNVYSRKNHRKDESGRYDCLFFHKGNLPRNFKGCSGLGKDLAWIEGGLAVSSTKDTCQDAIEILREFDELTMTIFSTEGIND
jgi:hypothetical protein